jgi:hypothetical protein
MRKIILASVMTLSLLYVGLIDSSYAKDLSELTGTEITEENEPMILAQEKSTTGNYEFQKPYNTKKVEEEEDDYDENEDEVEEQEDDPDAGVRQKKRNEKRSEKVRSVK